MSNERTESDRLAKHGYSLKPGEVAARLGVSLCTVGRYGYTGLIPRQNISTGMLPRWRYHAGAVHVLKNHGREECIRWVRYKLGVHVRVEATKQATAHRAATKEAVA
jgi:hypothetical protein